MKTIIFFLQAVVLTACGVQDIDTKFLSSKELNQKFNLNGIYRLNGYAKGNPFDCDIYIITPEEFAEIHPGGYFDPVENVWVETWENLYNHEKDHCEDFENPF